eukprot:c7671_g1_i2.p1 GENE.c7671_g1_i2~~c7671_g1_i2.p1  ORF type:complete len:782 (-),score=137.04 c7671_g1_i2:40-2385(-)
MHPETLGGQLPPWQRKQPSNAVAEVVDISRTQTPHNIDLEAQDVTSPPPEAVDTSKIKQELPDSPERSTSLATQSQKEKLTQTLARIGKQRWRETSRRQKQTESEVVKVEDQCGNERKRKVSSAPKKVKAEIAAADIEQWANTHIEWVTRELGARISASLSDCNEVRDCDVCQRTEAVMASQVRAGDGELCGSKQQDHPFKPLAPVQCSGRCGRWIHPSCDQMRVTAAKRESQHTCADCVRRESLCGICGGQCEPSNGITCSFPQCSYRYHAACLQLIAVVEWTGPKRFICPLHTCAFCATRVSPCQSFVRCLECCVTYHSPHCVPPGLPPQSLRYIRCVRHTPLSKGNRKISSDTCSVCYGHGELLCCETCPATSHLNCVQNAVQVEASTSSRGQVPLVSSNGSGATGGIAAIGPKGEWHCRACMNGTAPMLGDVVWVKYASSRWWPAQIVPSGDNTPIPARLVQRNSNPTNFVVMFFGEHELGFVGQKAVVPFADRPLYNYAISRQLDVNYKKGVLEAKEVYSKLIAGRAVTTAPTASLEFEPLHKNINLLPKSVRMHMDDEACMCTVSGGACRPNTSCMNREQMVECNSKICPCGDKCENQFFRKGPRARKVTPLEVEGGEVGLQAGENIPAHSFILEFRGELITTEEVKHRIMCGTGMEKHMVALQHGITVDATKKGTNARFIRSIASAQSANCHLQLWVVGGAMRVGVFATRRIDKGEEILWCAGSKVVPNLTQEADKNSNKRKPKRPKTHKSALNVFSTHFQITVDLLPPQRPAE